VEAAGGIGIVGAGFTGIIAEQGLLDRAGGEQPAMQGGAADAQGVGEVLVGARAETI